MKKNNNFLPDEILVKIVDSLSPQDVTRFGLASKHMSVLSTDRQYWKGRLKTHFPHVFSQLPDTQDRVVDYQQLFRESCQNEYCSREQQRLFSLMKDGDLENLKTSLRFENLFDCDKQGLSLFQWAETKNKQTVFNYIYQLAEKACVSLDKPIIDLDFDERKILHWAILCYQSAQTVESLLEKGAAINAATSDEATALHLAAARGQVEVVKVLLANEVSVDADAFGHTALHFAVKRGHAEVVKVLLANGAEIINPGEESESEYEIGYTTLHLAAEEGHAEVVKVLLANKEKIDNFEKDICIALHSAAARGHAEVVKVLLANGAEINDDLYGYTALYLALRDGHAEVVKVLLANGAEINSIVRSPDGYKEGYTALHLAAKKGHVEIVELLLVSGAVLDNPCTDLLSIAKDAKYPKEIVRTMYKHRLLRYIGRMSSEKNNPYHGYALFSDQVQARPHYSFQQRKEAAEALKRVVFDKEDPSCLEAHQGPLNDIELREAYHFFKSEGNELLDNTSSSSFCV